MWLPAETATSGQVSAVSICGRSIGNSMPRSAKWEDARQLLHGDDEPPRSMFGSGIGQVVRRVFRREAVRVEGVVGMTPRVPSPEVYRLSSRRRTVDPPGANS
jgi:hypothetical protein